MNPDIMRAAGFGAEVDMVRRGLCPFCSKPVKESDFRDELSRAEFAISGLCQKCQDEVFCSVEATEETTEPIAIHTHDRITFKRCRRKWLLSSPLKASMRIKGDQPLALWLGTGGHFALEDYHGYRRFPDMEEALGAYYDAFSEDELPPGAGEELGNIVGILEYYKTWLARRDEYETVWIDGVPQVEVHFQLELRELSESLGRPVYYEGTFDRVVVDSDGGWWLVDYKFVSSIDTDKLETDLQVSSYLWAAEQHYQRPFEGMLYIQLTKSPPEYPKPLVRGGLSVDKRQRTTHALYRQALLEFYPDGKFPQQYIEFLNYLAEQETPEGDRFIWWTKVRRNQASKMSTFQHILMEGYEMLNPHLSIYPNSTRDCMWDCSFRSVCLAMDDGGDWEYLLKEQYEIVEERDAWRNRIKWPEQKSSQVQA
jgi:hypothetical protein